MEEKDMAREQLNDQIMEEVVGGSFSFYSNSRGEPRVNISNLGVYACTPNGFTEYIEMKSANPGASEAELLCLLQGAGIIDTTRLA